MSFLRLLMAPLLVLDREPLEAKKLLEQLCSRRVRVRREAIEGLAHHIPSSGDAYLPELLQALADRDGEIRACAAHLLGQMGPKAMLASTALARALSDPEADVRLAAAYALGHIGAADDSLVPVLLRQMLDREEGVRVAVIQALGALGEYAKEAVVALLEALQRPLWEERWAAATALGLIGQPRALPFLHQQFYREPDEVVRASILDAIALLGAKEPAWVAVFMDGIDDPAYEVRLQAAQALASWGPIAAAAAPHLCHQLDVDSDLQVRAALLHAIGKIGDTEAIPQLLESLDDIDVDFSFAIEVLMALGRLGGADVLPALLAGLQAPEPTLRGRAALALGHAGEATPEVLKALHKCRNDKELGVELQATQALARLHQIDAALERPMGDAIAFWAARNITTMTGMLPLPQDKLDDAMLMIPGPEESEDALQELHFAIAWLQRQRATIWQRQRQTQAPEDSALLSHLNQQVGVALDYMQYQPLAPPGAPSGKRIKDLTQSLAALQQQLRDDPIAQWQNQLEEALFEST